MIVGRDIAVLLFRGVGQVASEELCHRALLEIFALSVPAEKVFFVFVQ